MPKAIKKKPEKKKEDIETVLKKARESFLEKYKFLVIIPLAVLLIAGGYFYLRDMNIKKAERFYYEGYKLYYGLFSQPLPEKERLEKALENFRKAYKAGKSQLSLYYISNCYYAMGRYDEAISTLRYLNERFPDDERFIPLTYYKIAMANLRKGQKEDALKALDILYNYKALSYKDLALIESAYILEEMGKKEEAKKKYETLIKDFTLSPFVDEAKARLKKG